jgi:hypothetical protein
MVIAAAAQLTVANIGGATAVGFPGQATVNPQQVDAGATGVNLSFAYAVGDQRLAGASLSIKVPAVWTLPQNHSSQSPGLVEASRGEVVIAKRLIVVEDVTLCKSCSLVVSYLDAATPAAVGPATFVTKVSKPGRAFRQVTPAPTVMVDSTVATTTTTSSTTTTTTTLPCNAQPVTASSNGVSMTVTPGTCLDGGSVVTLSGSGFDPSSSGLIEQCSNAPGQPTVPISVVGNNETLPVSCTPLVLARVITTDSGGHIPAAKTYSVIAGTTGPPCGAGSLAPTCPSTDSSGGDPVTDAAQYPCPPTPAQVTQGASCTLTFADSEGKTQTVDISYAGAES